MLSTSVRCPSLIFLTTIVFTANCLNFGDFENRGLSCPEKNSCRGFRGYNNGLTYLDRSCECDSQCISYKDCCIDAFRRRKSGRKHERNNVKCLNYGDHPLTGVYAVSDCSKNWNGHSQVCFTHNFTHL